MTLSAQRAAYSERLEAALERIREVLPRVEGIERVSLFGSAARGRRDLFTDVDLLVVWDTTKPFVERLKSLYALLDLPVDLDVICYTPAEFRELREEPFLRAVGREEVILFEKKPA